MRIYTQAVLLDYLFVILKSFPLSFIHYRFDHSLRY